MMGRAKGAPSAPQRRVVLLGASNLTKALGITIMDNRLDLATSKLTIEDRGILVGRIATGPRIGIRVAIERPWRYWVEGHRSVSGRRKQTPEWRPGSRARA